MTEGATVSAASVNDAVSKTVDTILTGKGSGSDDAYPFFGFLCGFSSCFTVFPTCIGCSGEVEALCLQCNSYNCKVANPSDFPEDSEKLFILGRNNCHLFQPKQYTIKCFQQYFCFDTRCGIPYLSGLPCILTCCFVTCFHKNKCVFQTFKTVGELK